MAGAPRTQPRRATMMSPLSSTGDKRTIADEINTDRIARGDSSPQRSAQPTGNEVDPLGAPAKGATALVSNLAQLGLDQLNIPLPKCVVLGQQSTGKSSVIEALTGIKTPRDTGTCTRCPLMIDLQPSEEPDAPWHASIYLQQRYSWNPQARQDANTTFPGWIEKAAPDTIAFAQTNDPDQLEMLIRRAQQATLSPAQPAQSFLDPSLEEHNNDVHKCLFSPNIVGIRITKHDLPTLSFYDLPGLISQAETEEEEYTVPLVENLVSEYIASPDTLILVTCALENDIANSTAAALARKQRATERCIGVLTKPDRLPQGSSPKHLTDILDGDRFKLGHGYHVTKNLDQDQIKQRITHQEARMLEEEFFKTQHPWATVLKDYQPRFGILNLQTFLSRQHAKHALAKLPTIEAQIDERLAGVDEELKQIPETPPHTAVRTVSDILLSFSEEVRREVEGDYEHTIWSNTWHETRAEFYKSLTDMKPLMKVNAELDRNIFSQNLPGRSVDHSIVIDSDSETADDDYDQADEADTPSKKRKFSTPLQSTPTRKSALPTRNRNVTLKEEQSSPKVQSASPRKVFQLDELRRDLGQSSQGRIGQVHHRVMEGMMIEPLRNWQKSLDVFFRNFEGRLRKRINILFAKHFKSWKDSELYKKAHLIVKEMLDDNFSLQKLTIAAESLNAELQGPYMFHKAMFDEAKSHVLGKYKEHRQAARIKKYIDGAIELGGTAKMFSEDKIRKDDKLMAFINAEPYEPEINIVANITTYYDLAARRFHDAVCMRIESKFFNQMREELRNELDSRLGISNGEDGPENAQRLLAESPARFKRRKELVAQKNALLEGKRYVTEFRRKYEVDDTTSRMSGVNLSGSSSPADPTFTPFFDGMDFS